MTSVILDLCRFVFLFGILFWQHLTFEVLKLCRFAFLHWHLYWPRLAFEIWELCPFAFPYGLLNRCCQWNKAKRHYSNISKVRCSECRKATRHNLKSSKSRCCQSGGKQHDIILKFEKSHVVNRCCQWRKAKQHNSQSWKVWCYQWRKANVEVSGWHLRLRSGPWGSGVVLEAQRWYELS